MDHPIYFASHKLSQVEHNYTTTEVEGLAMCMHCKSFVITYWVGISSFP
uniref:Reverse transcriptase/retrotransposon-derived protein RNase H-like domain-containing protein n=1 Tax=Picea glauca TaxID=3330 RepID=A0A124GMB3_PICGL|nr:hypothetical protein ABT39_MTgene3615 [Picea glauca]KUM45151.1 hypothetical protein ABT39_MTgene3624 [Picea glauca]KUM51064.1 hypothetical protein ABT39_MTgene910 [Picea glauca]